MQGKTETKIAALILCGGQASRMGNIDKGLAPFKNKTLVQNAITKLQNQTLAPASIIINANRNIEEYKKYALHIIKDKTKDFAGPLSGIYAGLEYTSQKIPESQYLLIIPCDVPHLPLNLCETLYKKLKDNPDKNIAAASTKTNDKIQIHPVISLIKITELENIKNHVENNLKKLHAWLEKSEHIIENFPNSEEFSNANTLSELTKLEQI